MTLNELNRLNPEDAESLFRQCCTSDKWVISMADARPFANMSSLLVVADSIWSHCKKSDFLQAFEGHPKIGDITSLKAKYANTKEMAGGEQSGVSEADHSVLNDLAEGNRLYEQKFGHIFIVCATGKSAATMLGLLQERLKNEPDKEILIAGEEQHKITRLRLGKLINETSLAVEA